MIIVQIRASFQHQEFIIISLQIMHLESNLFEKNYALLNIIARQMATCQGVAQSPG